MERFRVEVGNAHGVKPENLVGAIANEAGLDSEFIGRIQIDDKHSYVELPAGMPKFLLKDLKRVWVCNHQLNISRIGQDGNDMHSDGKGGEVRSAAAQKPRKPRTPKPVKKPGSKKANADSPPSDFASGEISPADKREKKKKERHRTKKNKGKRKPD